MQGGGIWREKAASGPTVGGGSVSVWDEWQRELQARADRLATETGVKVSVILTMVQFLGRDAAQAQPQEGQKGNEDGNLERCAEQDQADRGHGERLPGRQGGPAGRPRP